MSLQRLYLDFCIIELLSHRTALIHLSNEQFLMYLCVMPFKVSPESIDEHTKTRPAREKRDVETLNEGAQSIPSVRDLVFRPLSDFLALLLP